MKSLQTSDETCGNPDPFVEKKLRVFPEINFGTGLGILPVEVGGGRTRCRSVEGLNPLFFLSVTAWLTYLYRGLLILDDNNCLFVY